MIKTMTVNEILQRLYKNPLINSSMINFIRYYGVVEACGTQRAVMIAGTSDETWVYVQADDDDGFLELMPRMQAYDFFGMFTDRQYQLLQSYVPVKALMSCVKLYIPPEIEYPEATASITDITKEDVAYILANYEYAEHTDMDYVLDRIDLDHAIGIRRDGKLVAFLMTHDDGAMGFLTVLPAYRKQGLAYQLTLEMIQRLRSENRLPFVHIEESNDKSMGLAKKLGYVPMNRIHWLERVKQEQVK